jgi:D-alanyl-D-alanine carboxypeptidase
MRSWFRTWIGVAVTVASLTVPTVAVAAESAGATNGATASTQRRSRVDAAVQAVMKKLQIPGVILGVWQRGQEPIVKAYGARNIDLAAGKRGEPMKTGFYMRIGSETKTFTATAVLQLVEEGKVGLEDPISKYVEGVPNGNAITVRELGEMRSGLASYSGNPTFVKELLAQPDRQWAPEELLAQSFSLPPTFSPGRGYEYSNTNFVVLGLLVEEVTGEGIGAYVQRHILRPLKMRHTLFPHGAAFPRPHPQGYTAQTPTGTAADSTGWNPSWAWAAGAMISNLHDLRIWAKAVATGTLLSPAIQRERERFIAIPDLAPARYGFGLFDVDGWIGHDGEVPGYESLTVYLPSQEATMVILTNTDAIGEPSKLLGEAVTKVITPGHVFTFGPPAPADAG